MILPENHSNRLHGLCALVIQEEAPSPLTVVCLADSLPQLTRQYRVMVASGYHLTPPFPPLAALYSLTAPSASESPTRPAKRPIYQRSIRLVIRARISLALRTLSVFVRMTWSKTRSLLDFQILPSTPYHSADSIALKRRPTAPEGVAYQLADCETSRLQRRCQIASSATTPSRCDPLLLCGQSPYTPCNNRCTLSGVKSGRSAFSSGGACPPPHRKPLPVPPLGSLRPCHLPCCTPLPPLPPSLTRSLWPCDATVPGLTFCGRGG